MRGQNQVYSRYEIYAGLYYLALRLLSFASTHQAWKYLNTTQKVLIFPALSYIVCFLTTVLQNQVLTTVLYKAGVFDTTTKSMKRFNNNMPIYIINATRIAS